LPLALALLFAPRDVHRALELLSLPRSPIPRRARGPLLDALGESAGVGSRAWREALADLEEDVRTRAMLWLEPPSHPRSEGAPSHAVLEVVDRASQWAAALRALPQRKQAAESAEKAPLGTRGGDEDEREG